MTVLLSPNSYNVIWVKCTYDETLLSMENISFKNSDALLSIMTWIHLLGWTCSVVTASHIKIPGFTQLCCTLLKNYSYKHLSIEILKQGDGAWIIRALFHNALHNSGLRGCYCLSSSLDAAHVLKEADSGLGLRLLIWIPCSFCKYL